ncbi:MAG: tetratricopeptide repeat protein, partial [Planctomycetes bacterium]|nr:tetratricopeptide repeat protein [Planctomycetota bacterium]
MASRVNVKFVVLLSASVAGVFAMVAGVAIWVLSHTGPELEREGDQLMAAGLYEDAMKVYGKAYNHDRSNIVRLDKYTQAIQAWTPDKPTAYSSAYWEKLLPAIYTRATILRTDVDSHHRYLQARYTLARWFTGRASWDSLASVTEEALGYFEQDDAEDAQWQMLRRYRGFALVALMNLSGDRSDFERDRDVDQAEQDLQAALRIDPDDTRAAIELSRFYHSKSILLMESRRTREAAVELAQRATDTIDSFLASHPDDATARAHRIRLTYVMAQSELDAELREIELINARRTIAQGLSEPLDLLFDVLDRTPTETIDAFLVDNAARLEQLITEKTERSAQLVDRLLTDRPDEPALLSARAMFSRDAGDFERAMDLYGEIAELAWPSVSMNGIILMLLQDDAQVARTDTALMIWDSADEADKPDALRVVRQRRAEVAASVRQNDPRLTLIDGKIAYAVGDFTTAQQKLTLYNEIAGGRDVMALHLLSSIYLRNNEFGSARDALRELTVLQPHVLTNFISLARVEAALNNYESARESAEAALRIDPESELARSLLDDLRALENPAILDATDPVRAALIRAQKLATGEGGVAPDVHAAIAVIDAALSSLNPSSPDDAKAHESLVVSRINLVLVSGDRATALEDARRWSTTYPDSEPLNTMIVRLAAPDTIEGDYHVIDAGTAAEHLKLIFKYHASRRRGDMDRASDVLARAIAMAPDDFVVLEVAFADALSREDFATARRLADQASSLNADRMNGASFTARLQATHGDVAEAVTTLRQATKSATTPAAAWRMMGVLQSQLGRHSEAIDSFQEALRRSPSDVSTILAYLDALVRAGPTSEALRVAREYEPIGKHDGRFLSAWLNLEAAEGDAELALVRREEIRSRVPGDRPNNSALVSLYIDSGRFDDAGALLDQMRTGEVDLLTVNLDAALHRKQSDIDGGRAVYEAYLESRSQSGASPSFADFAAYASYLFDAGLVEDSLAVLALARDAQNPDAIDADVTMGLLLYELGRYEEAIEPLTSALSAGAPRVRVPLASCYTRLDRYEQAEATIMQAGRDWIEDMQLTLAMIECADRQGDAERTRRLADDAVRRFSESPEPFIQRAMLLARDDDLLGDALQDLNTAVRRDPSNWIALSLRADMHRRLGREDNALADLRSAVRSNPGL